MTFNELIKIYNWKPIRNCPGRYILTGSRSDLSPEELLGEGIEIHEFQVEAAKDTVLVARLNQGGLISYKRTDNSYLHTLNTDEGFERKLQQLGIVLT